MNRRVDPEAACRVSIETRKYLEQQAQNEQYTERRLDPWNEGLMSDLFGRLAEPISSFLIAWAQVEKTTESFGADGVKAFEFMRPHLQKLKEACEEEMNHL